MKKLLLPFTVFLFSLSAIGQHIVINEFMAKNNSTIQDKDGEYNDWIELYNSSDSPIQLANYKLSDDAQNLNQWTFPEITILPDSFLLIFASGKDILDTSELHTNFKISSSGEELFLSNDLGEVIDQTASIPLYADQSYGRVPDGSNDWIVINTPSPDQSNNTSNELTFSHQEGFYTSPFKLNITPLIADTIYYTLNGDVPTEQSNLFSDSIFIDYRKTDPNVFSEIPTTPDQSLITYDAWESPVGFVDKATILRCASYRNGKRTSKVYNKTFFVEEEVFDKYTVPVISLISEGKNFFEADSGIYVPGINVDSLGSDWAGNYFKKGENWERPVHIEYFNKDGVTVFSQDAGIRIHGGKTRQRPQKSLRLYARNEYGKKYFTHKIFPQKEIENYKRFILRTTMGSWGKPTIIKDALAHDISRNLDVEYQDFQPAVVYLNGEYWGIHTLRDRIDERYIGYLYNIDHESVEIKETTNADYENLMLFIENNDLSANNNYEYVKAQMDIHNYIDYTIAEHFFANYDWPGNNMKLWRELPNGKWRWIFYDIDAGFGDAEYNMLNHSVKNDSSITWPNPPSSTFLFRNLLKNENFKSQYVSRYAELLKNDFSVDKMKEKYFDLVELYAPEIEDHVHRWNYPESKMDWEEALKEELLDFIEKRPCAVRENIMDFFDLSEYEFEFVCDTNNYDHEGLILAPNPNNGNFSLINNFQDIENGSVKIVNLNGQIVYNEDGIVLKKGQKKYFKLPHLSNNTYVLHFISKKYVNQYKLIILN